MQERTEEELGGGFRKAFKFMLRRRAGETARAAAKGEAAPGQEPRAGGGSCLCSEW